MNIVIYGTTESLYVIRLKITKIMLEMFSANIIDETVVTITNSISTKVGNPSDEELPFLEIRHETHEHKIVLELGLVLSKEGFDVEIPPPLIFIPKEK